MPSTLNDAVRSVFTDVLITKFAVLLGETEGNVQKAVHGAIPTVITDIFQKAHQPEGTARISTLAKQAANSDFFGHVHELTNEPGGLMAGSALLSKGTDFAKSLLGTRTDAVNTEISRYAGVSVSTGAFVSGIVSFAALDAVGRHIANTNADPGGLGSWLKAQEDDIEHTIPVGLQVKPALAIQRYPWERQAADRRNTSLYLVLVLVVLALVIFFVYRSCEKPAATTTAVTDTTTTVTAPPPSTPDTISINSIKVTLPNGKVLDAYKGGTEDRLVDFLKDPDAKIDKKNGNWFDFTKIGFASNSSELLLESDTQLRNIVAILDAFPRSKIKIGGYTDNTGDSANNVRLSRERAEHVQAKLKELGAKSSQLAGSEGYGPNHAVGDNGTAAGRALNRRMSINVKAK